MEFDEQSLGKELQRRYLDIRSPRMKTILVIQDEVLSALRDFLRGEGFIEILAPIIGPVTDPGIRGAKQVAIDYYGHPFKIMSSMILYKQMVVCSLGKVFALSPNVRLEPPEALKTGRHLAEFRQLDLEVAKASYRDVMSIAEQMQRYVCQRISNKCREELKALRRELKVPKVPFKRLSYHEAVDLLRGEGFSIDYVAEIPWDAEEHLSGMFSEPFFIYDYPETARGFYDREDPERSGILRDFDLIYPEGFGEAISGGEREYEYEKVVNRMRKREEDPTSYGWYLEMLKDGIVPSAGFGIGVERLTRYLCGASKIWETVPFPKVPGIASP
jgi:asparaginyl-tRNA synthetase